MQGVWDVAGEAPLESAGEREQVAGHTGTATVTNHATLAAIVPIDTAGAPVASTPIELPPIDYHLDVLIPAVMLNQLRVELIGEGLGNHAIDHLAPMLLPARQ